MDSDTFRGVFTPAATGPHRILVDYSTPDIPNIFLHIEDGAR